MLELYLRNTSQRPIIGRLWTSCLQSERYDMPVYTYRCENCGVRFDHASKFTEPQLTRCPECGKKSLKKVYQPVGIVFKGSGFYATDHKSPSGGKKSLSQGEGKSNEEPSSNKESSQESSKESAKESAPAAHVTSSDSGSSEKKE